MELKHIDLASLCISAANMRAKGKPDISSILPSIRARGVLVPLIVRPADGEDRFEIVAGKRRYHAALVVSEAAFDDKRRAVLALLRLDPETPTVTGGYDGEHGMAGLFVRLIELPDPAVLGVAAIVIGETVEAGSTLIEVLGPMLGTDMAKAWQSDDALFDMIRDREVLHDVLADVAGESVAQANEGATGKVKRKIVRDCLTGQNGRAKVEGWVPKWMVFPPAAYTERGGVATVSRAATVSELAASPEPEPLRHAA